MSERPTPETPSDQPSRLGRMLRLPRLSGKASAACLVIFFLATGLLIPGVVRLPLWIDFEIVLAIWWLGWLIVLAVLLYRGQRVTDDHRLGEPRNWLNVLKGEQKPADPLDIRKRESCGSWLDGLQWIGPVEGEGCLALLALLLVLVVGFFALWFLIEIAIPLVLFLLYVGARGMLAAVINDRHRCPGRLGRSLAWSLVWATAYTAPLAVVVWFVHYVVSQQA
ncbi:MAG TPA: hypothetical protein VFE62_01815 [Gemmataceae bacterium]|nr:hypothetical protein [Gemmataceae bacterium]